MRYIQMWGMHEFCTLSVHYKINYQICNVIFFKDDDAPMFILRVYDIMTKRLYDNVYDNKQSSRISI